MKEQFCNYEIALKLKQLGFGIIGEYIQLPYYYDLKGNLIINRIGVRRKNKPYQIGADTIDDFEAYLSTTDNSSEDFVLAPLWQQVIDWFREKHDLHISIESYNQDEDGNDIDYQYTYRVVTKGFENIDYKFWNIFYNTYEEAREQAILKAIELCKKN
jgi:hypothetical protein